MGADDSYKSQTVMVVHGRNSDAERASRQFLGALGLRPISWDDAVSGTGLGTPHTLEAVRAALEAAQAVLVVFAPEDEARLIKRFATSPEESEISPQPRPNVLFEAGMAFALYPQRTVVIEIGRLRRASDLEGLNAIRMTDEARARHALKRRLVDCGCDVVDSDAYLNPSIAGQFELAVLEPVPLEDPVPGEPKASMVWAAQEQRMVEVFFETQRGRQSFSAADLVNFMGPAYDRRWAEGACEWMSARGTIGRVQAGLWRVP